MARLPPPPEAVAAARLLLSLLLLAPAPVDGGGIVGDGNGGGSVCLISFMACLRASNCDFRRSRFCSSCWSFRSSSRCFCSCASSSILARRCAIHALPSTGPAGAAAAVALFGSANSRRSKIKRDSVLDQDINHTNITRLWQKSGLAGSTVIDWASIPQKSTQHDRHYDQTLYPP